MDPSSVRKAAPANADAASCDDDRLDGDHSLNNATERDAQAALSRAAAALARKGMAVFPCRPRNKTPITAHGCLDASSDLEKVSAWWAKTPAANIGLATGARSGVWVLDIDGDAGETSLRELEAKHSPLPRTIEVITGSGGRHLYFRVPEIPVKSSVKVLGDGLDTRGDGGYVIAPPSVHPNGRSYAWSVDSGGELANVPAWILELLDEKSDVTKRGDAEWVELAAARHGEGSRNAAMLSLAGLAVRGVAPFVPSEAIFQLMWGYNLGMCDPPLAYERVEQIVKWCLKRDSENARRRS